jgi:hypothetical protein
MVEKGDVRYMGLYQLNRIYFISNNKIELWLVLFKFKIKWVFFSSIRII